MKIPHRYQIFSHLVVIDDKDFERLSPYLTGWNKLVRGLQYHIGGADLERLVIMELLGKRRWAILDKLLTRIAKEQKRHLRDLVFRLL